MNTDNWTTVTPTKRYRPPMARDAPAAPPAPARKPKREEEFPALVKGVRVVPKPTNLENKFNNLAREMEEERIRQEMADAEAARQRRKAANAPFPGDPFPWGYLRSGQSQRYRLPPEFQVAAIPMEYRDEDWDPIRSAPASDDEGEQNTDLADHHDRHH